MYIDLLVPPYTISQSTTFSADVANNQNPFPLMCVDIDSYIVSGKLETSLNFHVMDGVLYLQIGWYSALAEDILFLMDVDKDYKQIFLGAISVFQDLNFQERMNRKRRGQIIIQNDCWIANGVTIMGGVTIHNGAIIAARSVVTKDVPPLSHRRWQSSESSQIPIRCPTDTTLAAHSMVGLEPRQDQRECGIVPS
jgi:virginiamycin A acetyltransferase